MVASLSPRQAPDTAVSAVPTARGQAARRVQRRTLQLIQGSLSGRKLERRAPWISNLHRATDGTLAGLGVCMLALSALTLHWQNHWGVSYQQLESSQVLEHKLQESSALLEQHHLGAVKRPGWLVPTSSEKLIYLPTPAAVPTTEGLPLLGNIQLRQIRTGY
ncbi:MAG: hypothetical protein WD136_07495 [Cyanobium sp.]